MAAKDYVLFTALAAAVYTDIRVGKIYNWLTLSLTGFAFFYHLGVGGAGGILFWLQGMLVGTLIFLLPFLLGGLGGGDIKLFGAIGALQGAEFAFRAAVLTGIAGGVIALAVLLKNRTLLQTLHRLWSDIVIIVFRLEKGGYRNDSDEVVPASKSTFPYGIPIVCGTLIAYLL